MVKMRMEKKLDEFRPVGKGPAERIKALQQRISGACTYFGPEPKTPNSMKERPLLNEYNIMSRHRGKVLTEADWALREVNVLLENVTDESAKNDIRTIKTRLSDLKETIADSMSGINQSHARAKRGALRDYTLDDLERTASKMKEPAQHIKAKLDAEIDGKTLLDEIDVILNEMQ